ncbi:MAG: DapH/DapD/GlmU-related protein, partial [Candidatus Omnitrophica bacterium]|nr:DapH/DapD/GlmU-related protein [Candidatus Omnitrophota bacterium]
ETIRQLLRTHKKTKAEITLLTTIVNDPQGYGRIIRNDKDNVINIIEEKDADNDQKKVREINVGAYVFEARTLFHDLSKIKMNNIKKEYYLTDIIKICADKNMIVKAVLTNEEEEGMGINSRVELAKAEKIIKDRVLNDLMKKGVTIVSPQTTFIDKSVKIGQDTVIYPHTVIEQNVTIGKGCKIGPFARIRPGSKVKNNVYVGTFVEIVRTTIGDNTKVGHQTYLGDTVVGKNVNIGAGTITANYDGKNKNKTVIEDGAFIGVSTNLIAPVKIGRKAVTGAGSVIPKQHNVPAGAVVAGVPAKIIKKK